MKDETSYGQYTILCIGALKLILRLKLSDKTRTHLPRFEMSVIATVILNCANDSVDDGIRRKPVNVVNVRKKERGYKTGLSILPV